MNADSPALTLEAYHLLNEILEAQFGLFFPPHKREVLESRLRSRLQALQLTRFMDYYLLLRSNSGNEMLELAKAVTNSETYFLRERYQIEGLFREGIALLKPALAVPGRLRLLCAGCSSGEEAYSLNFYAKDNAFALFGLDVEIDAFDLDPDRLELARRAEYRTRSLRDMSSAEIQRYLRTPAPEQYIVKQPYRSGVSFAPGNVVDLESFRRPLPYDVVFCRNVLIYFSEMGLRRAIENLARVLRPGGLLFLGHAESIIGLSPHFEIVRLGACVSYRRLAS